MSDLKCERCGVCDAVMNIRTISLMYRPDITVYLCDECADIVDAPTYDASEWNDEEVE